VLPFAIENDKGFTLQICKLQHSGIFILEGPNETSPGIIKGIKVQI
jgi:hypothetical protein